MPTAFRPCEPDRMLLPAPAVRDWLPEGHLALYVSDLHRLTLDSDFRVEAPKDALAHPPLTARWIVGAMQARHLVRRGDGT